MDGLSCGLARGADFPASPRKQMAGTIGFESSVKRIFNNMQDAIAAKFAICYGGVGSRSQADAVITYTSTVTMKAPSSRAGTQIFLFVVICCELVSDVGATAGSICLRTFLVNTPRD
jgi:hypothetical protein